jgi:hypothetical protein
VCDVYDYPAITNDEIKTSLENIPLENIPLENIPIENVPIENVRKMVKILATYEKFELENIQLLNNLKKTDLENIELKKEIIEMEIKIKYSKNECEAYYLTQLNVYLFLSRVYLL